MLRERQVALYLVAGDQYCVRMKKEEGEERSRNL